MDWYRTKKHKLILFSIKYVIISDYGAEFKLDVELIGYISESRAERYTANFNRC